jgi:aldehyde dehydrogenase (NAD+)
MYSIQNVILSSDREGWGYVDTRETIFIGGAWVSSTGSGSLPVSDSATEEQIGSTPAGSAEDVDRAVKAAAAAFESWAATAVAERSRILTAIADGIERRADEITAVITKETGQPYRVAQVSQTGLAVADLRSMVQVLPDIQWEEQMGSAVVVREPAGVVAAITPWNAPLHQVAIKVGAAIAAGCTVVLKPSEVAPFSAFILAEIAAEHLPKGVFNLVSGTGPVIGEAMVTHPLVDMVSLTGSLRAGTRVMELASSTVKRISLELGGKSANIILADGDLETAVPDGVEDLFRNSGQVCAGLSRMLVPRSQLARAEELAKHKAESYILGDPFDPATTLGPVASAVQRDRVANYIRTGTKEGAKLITGGPDAPEGLETGYYVRPTVFSDVDNDMTIAREEIFGPVMTIIPYDTEEEAIAIANDSPYGLAAGVWAGDDDHALRVARQLRVGRVRVNGGLLNRLAPHGGYKQSGLGREWGRYGVEEFLEVKSLLLKD